MRDAHSTASIVGVGPLGYDDIETPDGRYAHLLGGSGLFFSLAAAIFAPTRLVAAVGSDLADADLDLIASRGVDVGGVVRRHGRSHRWAARYTAGLSRAETLVNDLGVMEGWRPTVPPQHPGDLLYIGSLEPRIQREIRDGAAPGVVTVLATQGHWIAGDRAGALDVCARCSMACVNADEVRTLTGETSVEAAAAALLALGTGAVVVTLGARGAALFHPRGRATCRGVPTTTIADPTGAGDSFAGGMLGHLARLGRHDFDALTDALAYGVACGSMAVERPAGERVPRWTIDAVERRRASLVAVRA